MEAVDRDNSIDVSSNQVPERLQGCPVNTRSSVAYNYRNLKRVLLSSEEKIWLFREVEGLINGLREDQICTKKGLIRRYKLHYIRISFTTTRIHTRLMERPKNEDDGQWHPNPVN